MANRSGRVNTPISTSELERRWAAVRAAMKDRKIDILLMQNNNDYMGGYVKYFTDIPAAVGYPITVTFPREDRMSVIEQGPFGSVRQIPPEGDGVYRGVKTVYGCPSYATVPYSLAYEAELAEKALEGFAGATIGFVGLGTLPISMTKRIETGQLSTAKFVDASDMVDEIKVIKSEEEISFIRQNAAIQDAAMKLVMESVKPGMKEIQIAAIAEHYVLDHGGEQGLVLTGSYQPGEPSGHEHRHYQNKIIRQGDLLTILVEMNGPAGFYTHLSRTCVFGKATQEMKDEAAFMLSARNVALKLLRPGTSCKTVWDAYNAYMHEHGRPEEKRLFCHGQGYETVERPLVRFDETFKISKNMNIGCHPTYLTKRLYGNITDNYLITDNGPERLHKYSEQLVELG
jgi:Xaa-Pro aminopeptidase